jgi:hypothetical protein
MNVRLNVAELVGVTAKTLSSIDVRTASVLIEGKWQNVMMVVRLSCDSAVTVSARVEEIWGKHGPVHTDEFRIDYTVLAFTEWAEVMTEFVGGQVRFIGYLQLLRDALLQGTFRFGIQIIGTFHPHPKAHWERLSLPHDMEMAGRIRIELYFSKAPFFQGLAYGCREIFIRDVSERKAEDSFTFCELQPRFNSGMIRVVRPRVGYHRHGQRVLSFLLLPHAR